MLYCWSDASQQTPQEKHVIEAISCERTNCGKRLKKSKTMVTWKLRIDNNMYEIAILHSKFTGKKDVLIAENGSVLFSTQLSKKNKDPIVQDANGHELKLIRIHGGYDYDLLIDNSPFRYRLNEINLEYVILIHLQTQTLRDRDFVQCILQFV